MFIRFLLIPHALSYHLFIQANFRYEVTSRAGVLAIEISLATFELSGDGDCTFALEVASHIGY
jgi:hypothetical protein